MSAFLGPIHIKMYNRILQQDDMSAALLAVAEQQGWAEGLRAQTDSKAPAAARVPLESIIDQSNIHGWLTVAVEGCEARFAAVVCGILKEHPERLPALQQAMSELGRQHAVPAGCNAEEAYTAIHDILLDGMPCDFPFEITASSADSVAWNVRTCPHAPYFTAAGCDADYYYQLRSAWVDAALENSRVTATRTGAGHSLNKEG